MLTRVRLVTLTAHSGVVVTSSQTTAGGKSGRENGRRGAEHHAGHGEPLSHTCVVAMVSEEASTPRHELTRTQLQQQLLAHWQMLKPAASPADVAGCARCAEPSAPSCRFHPDARAFAFGSGRFDFAFSNLWDTPHDHFFCCNSSSSSAPGCLEEVRAACYSSQDRCCFGVDDATDPATVAVLLRSHVCRHGWQVQHTADPFWWLAYEHMAPALSDNDDSSQGSSDSNL